jgi:hypothetical protein
VSYLTFQDGGESFSGKTKIWRVMTVAGGTELGQIKWYGPWRRYCFYTEEPMIFDHTWLEEILGFVGRVNAEHREKGQV